MDILRTCRVESCFAKLTGDDRCHEHGGHPRREEREDIWGRLTVHECCHEPQALPPQSDDVREWC